MRIKEYMREMYIRIMYILFSVIITSICAYASAGKLIYILAAPLEEAQKARKEREKMTGEWKEEPFGEEFHFIFTEITEAFMAATKLSMFIGMYMQWPIILYQLWLYIKPGLYQYESKGALATMIIA
jgi:Sec-independent protein secretion pathway component TatC